MSYYGELSWYNTNMVIYPSSNIYWSDKTDDEKEAILEKYSLIVDNAYKWVGRKSDSTQTLEFPRDFSDLYLEEEDYDPYYVNDGEIPDAMQPLILELIDYDLRADRFIHLYASGVRSINDGVLNASIEKSDRTLMKIINQRLYPFTTIGYMNYRKAFQ